MEERIRYGGYANVAYDPCYHQYCDTVDNVNQDALIQMARAAAYSVDVIAAQEDLASFLS